MAKRLDRVEVADILVLVAVAPAPVADLPLAPRVLVEAAGAVVASSGSLHLQTWLSVLLVLAKVPLVVSSRLVIVVAAKEGGYL